MTGEEAIAYIHDRSWLGSRLGLDRTRALLDALGNPQEQLRFVHVAGTNGKGSVAAMCAAMLRAAGYRTGLYTSPYLRCFHERARVDGEMIPDATLGALMGRIRPIADAMGDPPTEFELITALAFLYFLHSGCHIVVLEAGLGGALDSTNVISTPEAAVITAIGLDHTRELGDTIEQIAAAKAGIIKPGGDVVLYPQAPSVEAVFRSACLRAGARLIPVSVEGIVPRRHSLDGQTFDWDGLEGLSLSLLGVHQRRNAAVALTTMRLLREKGWRIGEDAMRAGLARATWPGRFEVLSRAPLFLVDGGHNPQCVEALAQNLREYLPGRQVTALAGVMADKDYPAMFAAIDPLIARYVVVTPPSPRALAAETLAELLKGFGKPVTVCGATREGVAEAVRQAGPEGAVCAFGSLYIVGDIRACFQKE